MLCPSPLGLLGGYEGEESAGGMALLQGKGKSGRFRFRSVLAAREEAVGEPGEGVRVVGVVGVVGIGPVVNGMVSLPVFG